MMSLASALILLALAPTAPAQAQAASGAQRVATTRLTGRALPPSPRSEATTHGSPRPWRAGWTCPPSPSCPVACGDPAPVVQVIVVNAPVYGDVVVVNAPVSTTRPVHGRTWSRTTGTTRTLASK